ncbi:hypothetical protein HYU21_05095 [Candidatus Woesearchaeota archaeon]|nr:hypothetical protein [Candidatus Woesearchaeota archaeon]
MPNEGWVVKSDDLKSWFNLNLKKLDLNEKEKLEFLDYWLNELPQANYYEIRLIEKSFLEKNVNLLISPQPDTLIRLNFYFKPLNKVISIKEPVIITPKRNGFTVVEWGGMLNN